MHIGVFWAGEFVIPNNEFQLTSNYEALQESIILKVKAYMYQGAIVWGQSTVPLENLSSPSEWEWSKENGG